MVTIHHLVTVLSLSTVAPVITARPPCTKCINTVRTNFLEVPGECTENLVCKSGFDHGKCSGEMFRRCEGCHKPFNARCSKMGTKPHNEYDCGTNH
ncbi:hypothetical protein PGT21_016129 [Puccinia graminis f. sp. tritici]|uniref:Uncharacterized protein n=1 Tax=Puccinia graminis f. sp. tritici TaxID=56615 RepID=A0A5B0QNZ3_PUCGR|nr:hypothetical protein PGT21_016129 [Puccinia graminis f. sp. tritici]